MNMREEFILEMRERLLDLQRELIENVGLEREERDLLLQDQEPKDTAEGGQYAYMSRILADLGVADQRRVRQIRAALDAISNQRYGICRRCGREISEERLEAIPSTPFCIECAKFEEKAHDLEGGPESE